MSEYVACGTVSPPSQVGRSAVGFGVLAGESLRSLEGPSAAAAFDSSAASSLLFFKVCSKSTRSLHCNSILRRESCNAFSVSVLAT
jgi:hypothetical protein